MDALWINLLVLLVLAAAFALTVWWTTRLFSVSSRAAPPAAAPAAAPAQSLPLEVAPGTVRGH